MEGILNTANRVNSVDRAKIEERAIRVDRGFTTSTTEKMSVGFELIFICLIGIAKRQKVCKRLPRI